MSEWIEITDPQSQNTFYANPLTGECCWDKPATGKIKPKDPTGEWWELYDENHKLPYYYNTITGQTEWLQPTTGTIIPLVAIQNSAIGKRMSVALQRNSGSYEDWNASRPPAHIIPVPLDNSTSGDIQPKQAENGPNFAQSPLRQSASNTEITPDAWNSPVHDKNTRRYTMKESPQLVSAAKSGAAAEIARRGGVGDPSLNPSAAIQMSPVHNHSGGSTTPYIPPADARSSAKTLPTELRSDISQFKIDGFAKKYFSTHKHGIFRRTVPVEKMLLWSKDSLRLPLIVLNKSVHKDALKCYKNIQRIMGDRSRPRGGNVNDEIQWLLNKGILHGELRDEIYVQLCKQLTENPTADSICKGWELMCVITITFPPSKNFENYLQTFIRQHEEDSQKKVEMFAKHATSRLKRICKIGPRGKVLTVAEIDRAKEAPFRPSVFGETLEAIMKAQRERYTELYLPRILPFLAESILKLGGQRTEGIFRVPGDADEVTELKVRLENGKYDVSGITDPNVPSSLFKLWLRELAEPLIPEEIYADCVRYAEDVPRAVSIVDQLPETNKRIVHYVINFLQLFAKPETIESTKMNVGNLAMVFAPNFLRCPSENLALIFENTKFEQAFMRSLITNLTNAPEDMRL